MSGSGGQTSDDGTTAAETTLATATHSTTMSMTEEGTSGGSDAVDTTAGPSESTTEACRCQPGEQNGCVDEQISICSDDCLGYEPVDCPGEGELCMDGRCRAPLCLPGTFGLAEPDILPFGYLVKDRMDRTGAR